jgi:hypothetical protein
MYCKAAASGFVAACAEVEIPPSTDPIIRTAPAATINFFDPLIMLLMIDSFSVTYIATEIKTGVFATK